MGSEDASIEEAVPAVQFVHSVAPGVIEYVPGGHAVHSRNPVELSARYPALQMQYRPPTDRELAGHAVHVCAPSSSLKAACVIWYLGFRLHV